MNAGAEVRKIMKNKLKRAIGQVLFLLLLVAFWQIAYVLTVDVFEWKKPYSVPSPAGVWTSILALAGSGELVLAAVNSMLRCMLGFAISILIGVLLGFAIHTFPLLERNLKPVVMGVQTLPSICWVPFSILWFGLQSSAILFVVIMGSAFSLAISVDSAIRNVNPIYRKVSETMGADKKALYLRVIFPACLPSFVSGLRQTWSFAWRALMSGEVMVTCVGLGTTLQVAREYSDINLVMLVMLIIILLGILIDKVVFSNIENTILEKRGL